MKRLKFEVRFIIVYLLIGGSWIIFSDKILHYFITDDIVLTQMQTFKGWFYVVVTAFFFYYLLKRHLIRLRKAEHDAKESDRLKTAFLQNISHEIRTPMNGIIGFTSLLNSDELPEEQKKEYIRIITKSSHKLLSIVDDVLNISLIETGNIKASDDMVNINEIMDELHQTFLRTFSNKISFSAEKGLTGNSAFILTDPVKLRQVLYNLINNAGKFTDEGFIRFGYSLKENELEFFVKDSGIGIDPVQHKKIFERFSRAEKENGRLYDGVGLGLAICKGNVDLLGGRIRVESEPGKGSAFFVTIPYRQLTSNTEMTERYETPEISKKITILVAEDDDTNFLYIKQILNNAGFNIQRASNGK
ncbi:MAG: hypothetical protein EOM73_11095, partial [Bacteroidia bacterium]|nr:hypothetical protein [Bacteroidia bacterium]